MSKGGRGNKDPLHRLQGVGVSSGVAIGSALVVQHAEESSVAYRQVAGRSIKQEMQRLEQAFDAASEEIRLLKEQVSSEVGANRARIFDAQMFMLADDRLRGDALRTIEREKVNAEWALREVRDRVIEQFKGLSEEYFRDRAADVRDVTRRVARHLSGIEAPRSVVGPGVIVVAREITPSEAAITDTRSVRGFVIEAGGRTSHTAILAKSLGIPAVVGASQATSRVKTGDSLLVDGARGVILIGPTSAEVRDYEREERTRLKHEKVLKRDRSKPAKTLDGRKVYLQANIELPEEVDNALTKGAEGIGLYRTEFLYLSQKEGREPTEDEHYEVYRTIATRVRPYSAIIRTVDLGGDKLLRSTPASDRKAASVMGLRAIRFCLANTEMFRRQIRALLRASAHGRLKVMLPFITSVEEVREARALVRDCMAELRKAHVPFNEGLEIGAMIEVPGAAMTADLLAREVSFFSIGTNDLIQYLLAVDRTDEGVSHLYEPLHPGLLRIIERVVEMGHAGGIKVGMCGEMAADPMLTPLLVGLGLDELSMDPKSIPAVKYVLRHVSHAECQVLARQVLELHSIRLVRHRLGEFLRSRVPIWMVGDPEARRPS